MKVEVTFGLLSFISAFVLLGWTSMLLIKLQFKNQHRIIDHNELQRTSCFTLNSLLTRFLWIVLIVSILWLLQCIFTFKIRLWSISIIDANDIRNKNNEHDITVIVLYFVFDLIALILLLILYYILSEELSNIYDLQIVESQNNQNMSHLTDTENVDIISSRNNPVTPSEKNINIYTPSQQRERRQSRLQRQELRRQALGGMVGGYERSESNSSVIELKRDRDNNGDDLSACSDDIDDELVVGQGNMDIFEEHDSGTDGDNEDETETQFLPNYPPNMLLHGNANEINDSFGMTSTERTGITDDSLPSKPLR